MYSKAQLPNQNLTGKISNNPEMVAKDSLKTFSDVSSNSNSQKLMALWRDDKDFQNLFNDKLIDFNDSPVNIAQKLNDLSFRFKRILLTQCMEFIKAIWDANPLLQAWFCAEKINFNQNKQETSAALYSISFDESLENFKKALTSSVNVLVMDIWNKNALLRSWYTMQETQTGYDKTGKILKQTIPLNALIDFFERCHLSQCESFNRLMWDVNPYLRQWLRGQAINIAHNNGYNEMQVISFKQMIKMFSAGHRTFSQKLWEENVTLQNYLFGKEVTHLGISYIISPDELSNIFQKITKEKQAIIIRAINKNNQFLKNWLNGESVQADSDEINKAHITVQCKGSLQSVNKQVATNLLDTSLQVQANLRSNPVNLGSIAMPCRSISQEEESLIIATEEDNWPSHIRRNCSGHCLPCFSFKNIFAAKPKV